MRCCILPFILEKPISQEATALLFARFGPGPAPQTISVPGRVNLIGEHIDYHNLPVLPMAIQRRIWIAFRSQEESCVRAISSGDFGDREFPLGDRLEPSSSGDWANYLKAAVEAVRRRWKLSQGIHAAIASDLPPAAGLSSSSALLAGFTIALLQANGISPTVAELMEVLPEGEHFVGTRGGGMDHAAVLAARRECALLVNFEPLVLSSIPIPADWRFLVAHSLTTAEKSGAARSRYNALRLAGTRAIEKLGLASYRSATERHSLPELTALADGRGRDSLDEFELRCFLHVVSEAFRVRQGVAALRDGDAAVFGQLLLASHESLRERLQVSSPALDRLVELSMDAGALGARLTGAGFGGCAVILCKGVDLDRIQSELVNRYYAKHAGFDAEQHLMIVEPSAGTLSE